MASGTAMKIETITVASGGTSSIVFNNIPQTYNDLKIVASGRGTRNFETDDLVIRFNGSSTNYSGKRLYSGGGAPGSSATSDTLTDIRGFVPGSPTTSDVFGSNEFYIANYTSSNNKSVQVHAVGENNGLVSYLGFTAGLWSNSSAITSITMLANNGNITEFSTFTLYGITRIPQGAKATGGIITDDSSYWYHTFTSSGTFTPNQNITCDYLVVAGGAGGGGFYGGGGGAGGLRCTVTSTGGGGTVESPLALMANTNYTVTIGAGGTAGLGSNPPNTRGGSGGNSVFSTITSSGGGGGGTADTNLSPGVTGGSGGGASGYLSGGGAGGSGTANQGFKGGDALNGAGGGGGGAGAAAANATSASPSAVATAGGNGVATLISGSSTIYAGGGGGGAVNGGPANATGGAGGSGGGGAGNGTVNGVGTAGTANTGGGGGGGGYGGAGAAGGSGIVIVRYAK